MNILLTGAAGLIGGEVAARLVARRHRVTALVHRNADIRANDGSSVAVAQLVAGDISTAHLGLDRATYTRLADEHDLLIHCAAATRFDLPESEHFLVNTAGTAQAIALAREGGMLLLHVSTAYVCGPRDGWIHEDDSLPQWGFSNSYEASKTAAERLVSQSGLTHAIVRPSIVMGDSRTGAIRAFESVYKLFKLIAAGHLRSLPTRGSATLEFVPIDHVAEGIVAIAEKMETASGAYHLVSGQPITLEQCFSAMAAYPHFRIPMLLSPADFERAELSARERNLYKRTARFYESYFQRDAQFDDSRFQALTGLTCPETGPRYVHRLIDYCIESSFISAGPVSQPVLS